MPSTTAVMLYPLAASSGRRTPSLASSGRDHEPVGVHLELDAVCAHAVVQLERPLVERERRLQAGAMAPPRAVAREAPAPDQEASLEARPNQERTVGLHHPAERLRDDAR